MPNFDVTIFLKTGATVKITQSGETGPSLRLALDREMEKDTCSISFDQRRDLLIIKNPKENVIGYYVDQTS